MKAYSGENINTVHNVIDATVLDRQRKFSEKAFGPGGHTEGIVDHIRKELVEIEENPTDIMEWADVIILGLDGAWRAGHSSQEIIDAIITKQMINVNRKWPDWRTVEPGKAIEHDRSEDVRRGYKIDPPARRNSPPAIPPVSGGCK